MTNLLQAAIEEVGEFVDPLVAAGDDTDAIAAVLDLLEVRIRNNGTANAVNAIGSLASAVEFLRDLTVDPPETPEQVLSSLQLLRAAFASIATLSNSLELAAAPGGAAANVRDSVLGRLSYVWLSRRFPLLLGVLDACGCIEYPVLEGEELRRIVSARVKVDAIRALLTNFNQKIATTYAHAGWDDPQEVKEALRHAARHLHVLSSTLACEMLPPAAQIDTDDRGLLISKRFVLADGADGRIGCFLTPLFNDANTVDAWGVAPLGTMEFDFGVGDWLFNLTSSGQLAALVVSPAGIDTEPANVRSASIEMVSRLNRQPALIVGSSGGSRLAVGDLGITLRGGFEAGTWILGGSLDLGGCQLVVRPSNPDGFLAKIVGQGIETAFDIGIDWTNQDGFSLRGSGSAAIDIPVHRTFGPLTVATVHLGGKGADGGVRLIAAVSAALRLGPVTASVEHLGVSAVAKLPDGGGNLGPLDLTDPTVQWPTGAGIAIDAGSVVGGGFLKFYPPEGRYDGIAQVRVFDLGLTAVALITTKLPDGSTLPSGFSLLAVVNVEFSPPIQLSFGFTLSGVGGVLGLNRTLDLTALRNADLDSLLFPPDPIGNATQILSDLHTTFPPKDGRFVVGLLARGGWGSPKSIVQADLGLLIELPAPVRLAILGKLVAELPQQGEAVVRLRLDSVGTVDFGRKELALDATLFDSKVGSFPISGQMALRSSWGRRREFAMALGGFHPGYDPPPNFPSLRRLEISLGSGANPRIVCNAYTALTPNSLQFGAELEICARCSEAQLNGDLSFDALVRFSPFEFEASMSGGVTVKIKGKTLSSIRLHLDLSGPRPWHAEGFAHIEVLCFDFDIRFQKNWGESSPATLTSRDPWPDLQAALTLPQSYGGALPANVTAPESFHSLQEPELPTLIHPAATVEIRQKVVPLDMDLSRYGNAGITGHKQFRIVPVEPNATPLEASLDDFARGQFEALSDDQRLSVPSFERLPAGVSLAANPLWGDPQSTEITYESTCLDDPELRERANARAVSTRPFGTILPPRGGELPGLRRFSPVRSSALVSVTDSRFSVYAVDGEQPPREGISRMEADLLARSGQGRRVVVPAHEKVP